MLPPHIVYMRLPHYHTISLTKTPKEEQHIDRHQINNIMAYRPAQYRPTQTGFMEPISRKTYYEDQYSTSKPDEEEHETNAIGLCDSSGNDDGTNEKAEQKRKPTDVLSRGEIKRSKCKKSITCCISWNINDSSKTKAEPHKQRHLDPVSRKTPNK